MHRHHNRDACYYRALRDILRGVLCYEHAPSAEVRILHHGIAITFKGNFTMMLPDDSQVHADISYVDAKGNAAKVEGAPAWETDRTDLLNLVVAADGMSADISAVGPLGSAQITVTADADLGAGVTTLTTLGTVEVIAGEAVSGTINFGEPTKAP